ncbi:hypothetical protein CNR27_07465 [Luteimonas chenhongjianii]|uniref:DUF4142 domain-containing protein n=1 Tax=Luteimonas chenhongjianii TaxID=2006110 RepID=A0A290XDU5_9GAMM|nr:DUF4142 domain-containing protein [Luteimonas chenhongjianii]ATD67297.1 hypothetical protein CNR27_07465 [Luteimonas chenhongjianii]
MAPSKTLLAGAFVLALAACENKNATNTDSGSGTLADTPNSTGDTEDRSRGVAATIDNGAAGTGSTSNAGAGMPNLAEPDRKALMAVLEVDRHEIEAAQAALAKNVQGPVREYAQTLRNDHSLNLDATRILLGRSGNTTGTGSGSEMSTVAGGTAATAGNTDTGAGSMSHGEADATAHPDLAEMKRKHDAQREQLAQLEGQAFEKAWIEAMVMGHQEALTKLDSELIPSASDSRVRDHLQSTRAVIAAHLETARALQQQRR